jgi:hypothetical protein
MLKLLTAEEVRLASEAFQSIASKIYDAVEASFLSF